ncbi:unnamed protein product, partial [Allacma fusca]
FAIGRKQSSNVVFTGICHLCQSIMVRRVQILTAVWFRHLISAVNWLWSLVLNVGTLSCSLAFTLLEDGYSWWK